VVEHLQVVVARVEHLAGQAVVEDQPSENRSLRASTACPRACSGDMKLALPLTTPVCVRLTRSFDFTMPKSDSFTSPASDTRMLPVAMSR
jgi:hypothetical protein